MHVSEFGTCLPERLRNAVSIKHVQAFPALDDEASRTQVEKIGNYGAKTLAANGEIWPLPM
jgi:hypothetical protein